MSGNDVAVFALWGWLFGLAVVVVRELCRDGRRHWKPLKEKGGAN